jgi:chromosome segregation ATPase
MAAGDEALRKALAEAKAALDGLTRSNADLTRQVEMGSAELRAVTEERDQLREQLVAAPRVRGQAGLRAAPVESPALAAQLGALERILAATRKELEACGATRSELSSQLAEAQARAEASDRQLEPLQAELSRATETAARAAGEIENHVRRAAELAAERDQARARAAELDKEAAGLRKALADCEAAGAKLSRDNSALVRQAEGAAAQLQACVAERSALAERLKAETARTAAIAAELKACSAERERLAGQLAQTGKAADLEAQLRTCTAERQRLAAEVAAQSERLADLSGQLDACGAARDQLAGELAEARSQADSAAHRLKEIEAEYRRLVQARTKAEADLADCTRQSAVLREAMQETAAALEACRLSVAESERRAAEAEKARLALADRLLALETESGLRDSELADLRERRSGDQTYVDRLRDTVVAETAKASMAVQQLEAVREQHRSEIPTADLVGNLATSFDAVNRQLSSSASSFRLGRTHLTLKAFLGEGGRVAFIPDAAHLAGNPALSEISVQLIPDDAPKAPPEAGLVVPDLLGLTETAVIRVLSSLFLKAGKAVESVVRQEEHGRALRQIPLPGTSAERGATVLVVYGAQEGA